MSLVEKVFEFIHIADSRCRLLDCCVCCLCLILQCRFLNIYETFLQYIVNPMLIQPPSIHHLPLVRGSGRGGSSFNRETQTSLSPATSSSSSGGTRGVPRPAGRHSLSNVSWVFPGVSSQWDVPGTPHQGGVQGAS